MITVSNELRHAMETRRNFINKATVTLADGTVLNLTHANFCMSGNKLTDSFSSGEAFSIGNAIAKSATMKINNANDEFSTYDFYMAMAVIYVGMKLDDTIEYLRKGTFTVTEPETPGSVIELSLVDDMYLFDRPYDNSTLVYPATLQSILSDCCLDCGVSIGFTQFDLYNQLVSEKPSGVTYRQVVSYVAQLAGYNARISTDNALELVWYDLMILDFDIIDGGDFNHTNNDDIIDGGDFVNYDTDILDGGNFTELQGYHNLYSIKDLKVATDNVVITGVSVTVGDTTKTSGETGYMIAVKDNPLATGIEQLVANHLATKLVALTFRPFSCKSIADPRIEVGDVAFLHDRKGNTYKTLITDVTFTTNSYTELECKAESPLKNSSTYFSQAANAVVQARRNTEKQLTNYDKGIQHLNGVAANAMGFYESSTEDIDGSKIAYMHDKPTLEASTVIYKKSIDGFFLSQDGGESWTAGFDSNGNAVLNILYAVGIVCDWIKGGTLTLGGSNNVNGLMRVLNASGSEVVRADHTGIYAINGNIGGLALSEKRLFSTGSGFNGIDIDVGKGVVDWSWNNRYGSWSNIKSGDDIGAGKPPNIQFWTGVGGSTGNEGFYITNASYSPGGGMPSWIRVGSQNIVSGDKGNVVWSSGSDARIKREIISLEFDKVRSFFNKINPSTFKYTEEYRRDDNKTYIGVIAQDLEEIFKDLEVPANNAVTETDDGWKFVNYQEFHGFELAGIKDLYEITKSQQETIDKQQAEIDELKQKVKLLIERVGE